MFEEDKYFACLYFKDTDSAIAEFVAVYSGGTGNEIAIGYKICTPTGDKASDQTKNRTSCKCIYRIEVTNNCFLFSSLSLHSNLPNITGNPKANTHMCSSRQTLVSGCVSCMFTREHRESETSLLSPLFIEFAISSAAVREQRPFSFQNSHFQPSSVCVLAVAPRERDTTIFRPKSDREREDALFYFATKLLR